MIAVQSLEAELEEDVNNRKKISGDVVRYSGPLGSVGDVKFGVWEVTPGKFEGHWEGRWEVFTVVKGEGTFTEDDGTVHVLEPGAIFQMGPDTHGVWEVTETLRKTYVSGN